MKRGYIPLLFILGVSRLNAQFDFYQDCPLDTNKFYELHVYIAYYEKRLHSEFSISNFETPCRPFGVGYSERTGAFECYTGDSAHLRTLPVNRSKIKSLSIQVSSTDRYDLSKCAFLKDLPVCDIRKLAVSVSNSKDFSLNLRKWPHYKANNDSMTFLSVERGPFLDSNIYSEIRGFKHLNYLVIPEYLNHELLGFKSLREINLPGDIYFFSNYLVSLPDLRHLNTNEGLNQLTSTSDMFPQKYFFFNYLDASSISHPAGYYDSLIRKKIPGKLQGTGPVYITFKELHGTNITDTIIRGTITNGQKTGAWRYNTDPIMGKWMDYNYDAPHSISFPAEGKWQYHYENGKLAIEGYFKNSKKDSTWTFYEPDGRVASMKHFRNDKPCGLFIDYNYPYNKVSTSYYFREKDYVTETKDMRSGETEYATILNSDLSVANGYRSIDQNTLGQWNNGVLVKKYKKGSPAYDHIMQQHFLRYLHPARP